MIMKHKQSNNLSQTLPIKVLFLSYLAHNEITSLMSDCHSAIDQRISKLSSSIESNYNQISKIVEDQPQISKKSLKNSNELMEVIEQQQYGTTQREADQYENQKSLQSKAIQKLKRKFNQSIKTIQKSSTKYEHIIYLYKKQLTDIAKELTKEKQINQKITKQLNERFKDSHTRSISSNKLPSGKSLTGTQINKSTYSFNQVKQKITKTHQQHESQDEQIRPPPKPFCQQCQIRQKQTEKKQKQALQQRNKWKALSSQITNLKDQLSRYEQQLINKQSQINKLTQEMKKFKQDDNKTQTQQKKKLRTMNTTLRGQKIVLENQLLNLKKKQEQMEDLYSVTESENKKLKIDNENLTSTIKWQENTIQDLRKNYSVGVKQQGEIMKKYRQMQQQNQVLCRQIQDQQKYLEQFVKKLQEIQISHENSVKKLEGKIVELQNIIEQKNQTIVKLKIQNRRQENNPLIANAIFNQSKAQSSIPTKTMTRPSGVLKNRQDASYGMIMNKTLRKENLSQTQGFQQNMIKLLNKKIVDKDETIQKLMRQNQDLKQLLQLSKDK